MRPVLMIAALFSGFTCSVTLVCSAATQSFVVKQATYERDYGAFRCEAELSANDDAVLTLTVPTAEKEFVLNTIHTSHPARIVEAAPANGNVVITIRLASAAKATVGVTYLKPIIETHRYRYGIELTTGLLDGYAQIFDRSGSNANWVDTPLAIHRGPLRMEFSLTMRAGESIIAPIPCLTDYPVTLAREEYYRLFDNRVYKVQSLVNPGTTVLPEGNVRVLQGGILQFVTRLEADLAAAAKADLRTTSVAPSVVEATVGSQEQRWFEAVRLDAGILHFRPRTVQPLTLENKTQKSITVHTGDGKKIEIPSSLTISLAIPLGDLGQLASANLFDFSIDKIEEHVRNLDKIVEVLPTPGLAEKISQAVIQLKEIQKSIKGSAELQAAKQIIEVRLKELSDAGAPPQILQHLAQRLSEIAKQLNQHEKNKEQATIALAKVLFS